MGGNDPVIRAMVRSTMHTAQGKNKQSGNKGEHGNDASDAGEASTFPKPNANMEKIVDNKKRAI